MSLSVWFWLCLFLFVLGYGWSVREPANKIAPYAWGILLVLMLVLLGMASFGGPIK